MAAKGIALATNLTLSGSSASGVQEWAGGRATVVMNAASYGTGVFLQITGPSKAGININSSTYSSDQVTSYDLPAGLYQMVNQSGSTVALYASIVGIPYY